MTPDQQEELKQWRNGVDDFISESNLFRRATNIQMGALSKDLEANTAMTTEMHSGLSEVLPIIKDMGGVVRIAQRVGSMLKPVVYLGTLIAAVVVFFKTGKWELLP